MSVTMTTFKRLKISFLCCILLVLLSVAFSSDLPCMPEDFGKGSVVCVCNSTYCDSIQPLKELPPGKYFHLTSSKKGKRFEVTDGDVLTRPSSEFHVEDEVKVNRSRLYQHIIGFGGAFTDAAGINIASLSRQLQKTIIELYYGKNGLEYNIGRVPIAGTDFSTHSYSYDDVKNDVTLQNFSLAQEDLKYKIPFITQAIELKPDLKLFGSPWSAPPWMKTNDNYGGRGFLRREYYQVWANYFVKFLDEYKKHNVSFWGLTTQNEPSDGLIPGFPFNAIGWTPFQQRDWIKWNLGPTLAASNYSHVKVIIMDDQRYLLPLWTEVILGDKEAAKYVSGVGVHWYGDKITPPQLLDVAHYRYPNYFLLGTEACDGSMPFTKDHVSLGSWDRAVNYASDIITDLNHFVTGWVDWNLVLDTQGGPNWVNNFVDAPIVVNKTLDVIYKQPMYYAMGHFSKYIPENSARINTHITAGSNNLEILAVLRPDGAVSVVLLNREDKTRKVKITDSKSGVLEIEIDPMSLNTIVYK